MLSVARLHEYRESTFRLRNDLRLRTKEDALAFVEERGFVFFWPIKGIRLPSLWTAVAGDRPVADAHDDPGHVTWGWKDDLLDKKQWYYAKILRGKATMISQAVVPFFYALSENFGDPQTDYLQRYEDGYLSREARQIYELLLREGPLDTVTIRRRIHMTGKASNSPFERALVSLQRGFNILPVGIARVGGWNYSFVYDLVHRYYITLPSQARSISRRGARLKLASLYFESVGAASESDMRKLFQWSSRDTKTTLAALVQEEVIAEGIYTEGSSDRYFVLIALLEA